MSENRKIIEYKLISNYKFNEFNEEVNTVIKEGWFLHERVFAANDSDNDLVYMQVVVKYETIKPMDPLFIQGSNEQKL